MDDDDYTFTSTAPCARRMLAFDVVVLAAFLIDEIAAAVHSTTTAAYNLTAMHANHLHEQATFREEAALEIETMTGGTDG